LAAKLPRGERFAANGRGGWYVYGVIGVVLILFVIFIAGPVGLFVVGAAWAALHGWLLSEDADARAADSPS
jgi:hypothetical protein